MSDTNVSEALAAEEASAAEGEQSLDQWLDSFSEQDLGAPNTGDNAEPDEEPESDPEADLSDEEEEGDDEGDDEGEEESEGGDEADEDAEEKPRETRSERRRRKIREEVEEDVRQQRDQEWEEKLRPVAQQMQQAQTQIQALDAEAEQQQFMLRQTAAQIEAYREFLEEHGLAEQVSDRVERAMMRVELDYAKAKAGLDKKPEDNRQAQVDAVQVENIRLETMANVAGIDLIDLKAELARRHRDGKPYDPQGALKALTAKQNQAAPARPPKKPKVLSGGGGRGAGAPALDIDLLTASDDEIQLAATELEEQRRQRRKG